MTSISLSTIGLGLMGFTWRPTVTPDEQAFAVMKEAINHGATFWNSGTFYNLPGNHLANLKLIRRYFDKYPEDAAKVTLSVKGCFDETTFKNLSDPKDIRASVDETLEALGGVIKVHIFESARIDPSVPLEQTIEVLAEYVKAGKIGGIGLSEVSAKTIRAAAKVHPIAAVEVEFSLVATHIIEDNIPQTCGELGIPIVAYSPLGMGILSGKYKDGAASQAAVPHMDRLNQENFDHNVKLVDEIKSLAERKNATSAQIALAWILYQSKKFGNPQIVPIPGSTTVERVQENTKVIDLTKEEYEELDKIVQSFEIKGGRYNEHARGMLSV